MTFLENTESYRRDLRRVEYGDERDPAMRAFLSGSRRSTTPAQITKPLFVVQGRNDPRVPYTEAEQIVAKARSSSGTPVWYLLAEDEGHGFAQQGERRLPVLRDRDVHARDAAALELHRRWRPSTSSPSARR